VMFKSCFPNSDLAGRPTDRPARGDGLTVANAKAIYMQLLDRFARRPDKLFIVVTAPPLQDRTHAANARALNDWLVHQWLADYTGRNVAVFDFYNVLTARDHHHRVRSGKIEHVHRAGNDTLAYPTGDDHPSRLGNRKATDEFVPLLNVYVNRWIATAPAEPAVMTPPTPTPPRNTPWTVRPQATDPAPAAQTSTIDDFEQGPRGWACFRDEANPATRLDFAVDAGVTHTGKASMRVDYNIAPESWATCSLVFDRVQDWSDADGLSLQVRPATAGQRVTIVAYGGSVDDLQHFESSVEIVPSKDGWQRLDIPWSQLEPAAWQSDADVPFNPRAAMGIALAFDAPDGQPNIGRLWIDEVKLLAKPSQ